MNTLSHSCRFDYQQRVLKTFPGPGYLCSENGLFWLKHSLDEYIVYMWHLIIYIYIIYMYIYIYIIHTYIYIYIYYVYILYILYIIYVLYIFDIQYKRHSNLVYMWSALYLTLNQIHWSYQNQKYDKVWNRIWQNYVNRKMDWLISKVVEVIN